MGAGDHPSALYSIPSPSSCAGSLSEPFDVISDYLIKLSLMVRLFKFFWSSMICNEFFIAGFAAVMLHVARLFPKYYSAWAGCWEGERGDIM